MKKKIPGRVQFGLILLLVFGVLPCWGTPVNQKFTFYFPTGASMYSKEYRANRLELSRLDQALNSTQASQIERVVVIGSVSPEGGELANLNLAYARAEATWIGIRKSYSWLLGEFGIPIELRAVTPDSSISALGKAVAEKKRTPCRSTLLEILGSYGTPMDKMDRIRLECGPYTYAHLEANFFGVLRYATVYVLYKGNKDIGFPELADFALVPSSGAEPSLDPQQEGLSAQELKALWVAEWEQAQEERQHQRIARGDTLAYQIRVPSPSKLRSDPKRAGVALKTNLLFDLATAVNAEIEVPVGDRWSIMASATLPRWHISNQYCMYLTEWSLEARFWFGDRHKLTSGKPRNSLTGHFLGVYGNWIKEYDFQYQHDGVMGNGYGAGLTYGFSHRLGRSWNMEYSLGVGAVYLNNKSFGVTDDFRYKILKEESSGWKILPTRLKVSLVWLIGNKRVAR